MQHRGVPVRLRGTMRMAAKPLPASPSSPFDIFGMVEFLKGMYADFQKGLDEVKKAQTTFESVKKGDPGMPGTAGLNGRAGRDVTPAMVEEAVTKILRQPENGKTHSVEDIAAAVMKSGMFFKLIKKRLKEVKTETPAEEKLEMDQIMTAVRDEISKLKLSPAHISGLDDHVSTIARRHMRPYDPSPGNARGGGDTVVAGTGVTITNNNNGNKVIGVSGVTPLTPTGTVNGVNVTFGVTSQPSSVIADGTTYFENHGYTYAALAITMDNAPSQYIRYYA